MFNIAVSPMARAEIRLYPPGSDTQRILLRVIDFDDVYALPPLTGGWGPHPLLEAAIDHVGVPENMHVDVSVSCGAPAGASTGTSAAVTVALIGALARLRGETIRPHDAAMRAHHVETAILGRQCGIQDQLCSAYGGINLIEMDRFPHAVVHRLRPPEETLFELERRLLLLSLGTGHSSSDVHHAVIRALESEGPASPRLDALREAARHSAEAVMQGDLAGLGRAMAENTRAQEMLHPDLVCEEAQLVIRLAREYGALGWKVNGAGGKGGSVTILWGGDEAEKRTMMETVAGVDPRFRFIPIALDETGLVIRESIP